MRVVDQAIQDRVSQGWIADDRVPGVRRKLTGHDRRGAAVSVLKHLQETLALCWPEDFETEVVEDQDVRFRESTQHQWKRPIGACLRQLVEETGRIGETMP